MEGTTKNDDKDNNNNQEEKNAWGTSPKPGTVPWGLLQTTTKRVSSWKTEREEQDQTTEEQKKQDHTKKPSTKTEKDDELKKLKQRITTNATNYIALLDNVRDKIAAAKDEESMKNIVRANQQQLYDGLSNITDGNKKEKSTPDVSDSTDYTILDEKELKRYKKYVKNARRMLLTRKNPNTNKKRKWQQIVTKAKQETCPYLKHYGCCTDDGCIFNHGMGERAMLSQPMGHNKTAK